MIYSDDVIELLGIQDYYNDEGNFDERMIKNHYPNEILGKRFYVSQNRMCRDFMLCYSLDPDFKRSSKTFLSFDEFLHYVIDQTCSFRNDFPRDGFSTEYLKTYEVRYLRDLVHSRPLSLFQGYHHVSFFHQYSTCVDLEESKIDIMKFKHGYLIRCGKKLIVHKDLSQVAGEVRGFLSGKSIFEKNLEED